ncbi:hypothetical protein [Haloferax volcanii]|uniref:hypothetical protein n=1 Tax=Haloferax volcanii TaxID=2246 RepID=UPI00385DEC3F
MSLPLSRRSLLEAVGALGVGALAGCIGRPKYDRETLDDASETPIPTVGSPSLPLPNGYLTTGRTIARERAERLDARLSNLPAELDASDRAVASARDDLSDARRFLSGSHQRTAALDAIRYARETLGEGHGWLDAAEGIATESALRNRLDDFGPLVAERRRDIEYRATTVPAGIVVASAIEERIHRADAALEAGSWDLDKAERADGDERVQYLAMAAGEVVATRVALADAGALIDGQRARVFENTSNHHGPMTAAAERLLRATSETVAEFDPVPTGRPVEAMVVARLAPDTEQASAALDRDAPATALAALAGVVHAIRIRARVLDALDAERLPKADAAATVVRTRRRAVDALSESLGSNPGPVERERLRYAEAVLLDGDRHLERLRESARRDNAAATDAARRATAAYAFGRYAVETANAAAHRVVSTTENEVPS